MKACSRCKIIKTLDNFAKEKRIKSGLRSVCKKCTSEYSKLRHVENKEEQNAAKRKYRAENLEISRACASRYAKANPEKRKQYYETRKKRLSTGKLSRGLVRKLYAQQNGICACCDLQLGGKYEKDHIIPLALGGLNVDENIQLLTPACNLKKSILPPEIYLERIKSEKQN